jgi:hypothetical protein
MSRKLLNLLENEYSTKDMHLAAFLKTKGVPIKKLEHHGSARNDSYRKRLTVYFIFGERRKCERLEDIFLNGVGDEIMVNAREYFMVLRDLKSRVFSVINLARKKARGYGNT